MDKEELLIKYGLVDLLPKNRKRDTTKRKGNWNTTAVKGK